MQSQRDKLILGGVLGGLAIFGYTCFQKNLYTQKYQFILWSPKHDITLGRMTAKLVKQQFKQEYQFVDEQRFERQLIQSLVDHLIRHAIHSEDQVKERKWRVNIIKIKAPNAMACADGTMFVFRGLLQSSESLDEVAFILSHEIAHALCRHIPNQLSTSGLFGLFFFLIADFNFITDLIYTLIFQKPKSRRCEEEADVIGAQICINAGFDASRGADFFERFQKLGQINIPAFFSTHPSHPERVKKIKDYSRKLQQKKFDFHSELSPEEKIFIHNLRTNFEKLQRGYIIMDQKKNQ